MPVTTRAQATHTKKRAPDASKTPSPSTSKTKRKRSLTTKSLAAEGSRVKSPLKKKQKSAIDNQDTVTIERGHIYFFYRPRVEHDQVESIDDVQGMQILLVPNTAEGQDSDVRLGGMQLDTPQKKFRVIQVGRKYLPDSKTGGSRNRNISWASVSTVGEDLHKLEQGLGEKTYETKTRGIRHQGPARLAGRGVYAVVNKNGPTPSKSVTHLGYYISHPPPDDIESSAVQKSLGIHTASSFVLQVKNPLAPAGGGGGLPENKRADYPEVIMKDVFGKGGNGRQAYGLKFARCGRADILDFEGTELLMIAAKSGKEGLNEKLGEVTGEALKKAEEEEAGESINEVLRELAFDSERFPAGPLKGEWM